MIYPELCRRPDDSLDPCCTQPTCTASQHIVIGEGSIPAKWLILGEGPGEEEQRTGRPFIGDAGKKLDEFLQAAHLNRANFYITNAVKCRTTDEHGLDRAPRVQDLKNCTPMLKRQIDLVAPERILALGRSAVRILSMLHILPKLNKRSLAELRQKSFGTEYNGRKLIVRITYHPSLKNKVLFGAIETDIKQFQRSKAPVQKKLF